MNDKGRWERKLDRPLTWYCKVENVSVIEFLCQADFFQFNSFLQNQFK
jgi:hypothetical protein